MPATIGSAALSTATPLRATLWMMTRLTTARSSTRADIIEAEVIAHADVGDHGDVAAIKAEAFAQDAAARGF